MLFCSIKLPFSGLTECACNEFFRCCDCVNNIYFFTGMLVGYFLSKSPREPRPTQKCNYPPLIKNGFNLIRQWCTSCYIVEIHVLTCDYNTLFVVDLTHHFRFVPVVAKLFLKSPLAGTKWKRCVRPVTNNVLSQAPLTLTNANWIPFLSLKP